MKPSYKDWLQKAENDLDSAKVLVNNDIFDTAIYHTQQAAEKALKGFLVYKTNSIKRTHDLEVLIDICGEQDKEFYDLVELAEELSPYAVEFRYPAQIPEPEKKDVLEAIEKAAKILELVKRKLD